MTPRNRAAAAHIATGGLVVNSAPTQRSRKTTMQDGRCQRMAGEALVNAIRVSPYNLA